MNDSLCQLKGIGAKKQALFARLGIHTIQDLLQYFPRQYEDRQHIVPIRSVGRWGDKKVLVCGVIQQIQEIHPRKGLSILKVRISDDTGMVELIWFNQPYKKKSLSLFSQVTVFGNATLSYGIWQMNNPEIEQGCCVYEALLPLYGLTEGLRQQDIRKAVQAALALVKQRNGIDPEPQHGGLVNPYRCMSTYEAYEKMHFPKTMEVQQKARKQLAFEELFDLQLGLLLRRRHERMVKGVKCTVNGALLKQFISSLSFTLTKGQIKAFLDIQDDMEGDVPMQRLIQGDVGSGKTVVAALALLKVVENGYQGVLMAPTEILATQHFEEFSRLFQSFPVKIALLTSRINRTQRKQLVEELQQGTIHILIGTHALLQPDVIFSQLGLVVTDEQHRFGVRQRAILQNKGKAPHVLFMTATPIPRTLALSVYGDLDVSSIREMPPGRQIVKTYVIGEVMRARMYQFMKKIMMKGQQCYVVCPLVEESTHLDVQAATALYEKLSTQVFTEFRCALVHGQLGSTEKEEIMTAFQQGKIDLLVATSVIEVGVNVPNATIMVIEDAERFGLAQLHQLRGRVGRGTAQSYCILLAKGKNKETQQRLHWMETIHDGFALSEKDLLLRGAGRLFGYVQHGLPDLKVANILGDIDILIAAREAATLYVQGNIDESAIIEKISRRFGGHFTRILNH